MSSTQQVLAAVPPASANGPWRPPVHRRLHGSDFTWTIALVVPYAAVFFACGLTLTVEVCDLQLPFAGERLFLNGTAADSIPKRNSGSHLTRCWRGESAANSSLKSQNSLLGKV